LGVESVLLAPCRLSNTGAQGTVNEHISF